MSDKPDPSRTSYAWQHRSDLPGERSRLDQVRGSAASFDPARDPLRARALADQGDAGDAGRGSSMVRSAKPYPAPRPSPLLALGPDRAAFNVRWEREVATAKQQVEEAEKAARREAFKAMRRTQIAASRARRVGRGATR